MNRRFALALGILSLGWLGGPALAQEPIKSEPKPAATATTTPVIIQHDGKGHAVYTGDHCMGCQEHCAPGYTVIGGVGVYYIKPQWEKNPAFAGFTASGANFVQQQQDFDHDYQWAPVLWGGAMLNENMGGRLRYTQLFSAGSEDGALNAGQLFVSAAPQGIQNRSAETGDQIFAASDVQFKTFDAEGLYALTYCDFNILVSGGIRYAHLSQSYDFIELDALGTVDVLSSGHNLTAWGPTAAVDVSYSLGEMGIGAYATARVSILYGNNRSTVGVTVADAAITAGGSNTGDSVIPITEIEAGGEFNTELMGFKVFARGGLALITWFGAGNATNNDLQLGVDQILFDGFHPHLNNNESLTFLGFVASAGLKW